MTHSNFPASKGTIMVVADDPDLVTIIKVFLKGDGYNVMCAYNVTQLFNGLEKQKPDLIILDIMIPRMDGLELLARLKCDQETSSIPVILLTSKTEHQEIWTGYKLGGDHRITKPFTRTQLMTAINSLLSGDQGHSVESLYKGQRDNV